MADEALCYLTLHELAQNIRTGQVSPVEVTQAHLDRCRRLNPTLKAFITLASEQALAAAARAEEEIRAGCYRGALHGIPMGIKDIFDTAGMLTTHGSSFFRTNVPEQDAAVVRLLRRAGAVVIGKCNTHEFAGGSTTNNPWYGAALNPWDLTRSPGGSSGGSGAAVAAFMCPGATGTDTGGSIRNPAACNGVVGLKPTYGRVSLQGIYPNAWSLDHAGPLARTVRDAALLLQGMAGYVPADPTSRPVPVPDFCAEIEAGIEGLRLAFCPDLHLVELDQAVTNALAAAGRVLSDLGARIDTVSFGSTQHLLPTCMALWEAEFAALHRERFNRCPEGYGEDLQEFLGTRGNRSTDDYVHASRRRLSLRRDFETLFEEVDALLLPCVPAVAPISADGTSTVNGKTVVFGPAGIPLRIPFNAVGLPALALPTGFSHRLPLSMQIVGPAWAESKLVRIGHAYEQATPHWRQPRPPHC